MPRLALIQTAPAPFRQLPANRPFRGVVPHAPPGMPALMRTLLAAVATG